ncbi:ATP-binding protein [Streptomyces violaceorubidus]|uniref:ATP-binding protein n=1 Tax=Streptomyces violaceorubidus TaxID=284042 RepID=UPI000AE1766A
MRELVTNALLHGVPPGRLFLLFLRYDGRVLRVKVHDRGGGVPRIMARRDAGGRGLLLVAVLSDAWGVREREPGKAVWCESTLRPRAETWGPGSVVSPR